GFFLSDAGVSLEGQPYGTVFR
ncbi:MAG: hypothetical protein QOC94_2108, partial [Actinoplanes sp.]|nr:hypothetical protein [Actinoplanes sp.]